ncbi:unnamed protein product [Brassica oleracea var. botrytis]
MILLLSSLMMINTLLSFLQVAWQWLHISCFNCVKGFDLRFTVIADRFPLSRTLEKNTRTEKFSFFCSVTRALLRARAQSPADLANHPLMKEGQFPLLYIF